MTKILNQRLRDTHINYLHGQSVQPGRLELLVDEMPKFIYRKIGDYYYAEKDGFVSVFHYERGSKDSFGNSTITLTMEDGSTESFKGTLWDPFTLIAGIPRHRNVSVTTGEDTWERGHTFCGGKITQTLYEELLSSISQTA